MKRVTRISISLLLVCSLYTAFCVVGLSGPATALQAQTFLPRQRSVPRESYRQIFSLIERCIVSGNVSSLSPYFAQQVHVNFRGAESGYYSASQAYYLLENYFRARKVLNFDFSTIGESDSNPYATGGAGLNFKGSREYAQVYVSLSNAGNRWVITQINIY